MFSSLVMWYLFHRVAHDFKGELDDDFVRLERKQFWVSFGVWRNVLSPLLWLEKSNLTDEKIKTMEIHLSKTTYYVSQTQYNSGVCLLWKKELPKYPRKTKGLSAFIEKKNMSFFLAALNRPQFFLVISSFSYVNSSINVNDTYIP